MLRVWRKLMEINGKSTISELMELLSSSFQRKEFKLVEGILIKREDDLRLQLKKEQQDLKQLKNEILELREELKVLRMEKLETVHKFLEYEERMANLEKAVAINAFPSDVSKVQKRACDSLENVLQKGGNSNLDCEQTLENTSNHHNNAQASYSAPSPSNGPCCETTSSHQEKKSCDVGTLKRMKDLLDGHSNAEIGLEGAQDAPRVHVDSVKQEKADDNLYAAALKSINTSSPIVIEIIESDDEAHTCPSVLNSSKNSVTVTESGINACLIENENERNVRKSPPESFLLKRKRDLTETDDSGIPPVCKKRNETAREIVHDGNGSTVNSFSVKLESIHSGSQSSMPYPQSQMVKEQCQGLQRKLSFSSSDDSSDYSSSDSDDDCSESLIKKMFERLQEDCRKNQKIWNAETDMQQEFLSNEELCMNAVCALYRKLIREELINSTSSPIDLDMFYEMSGKDIAEYLIDGDPQYKLKRTVSEVQEKDSELLSRCKVLALRYYKTLFEIYSKNEDPFFTPSS